MDKSKDLMVAGYIRSMLQKLLSSKPSDFKLEAIKSITMSYIDDNFNFNDLLFEGTYQWKIENIKLLSNILNAPYGKEFISEIFSIFETKWILRAYPNGHRGINSPQGHFDVFLELVSMPKSWDHILIRKIIECDEVNTKWINTVPYQINSFWGWPLDQLSLNEVKNSHIQTLTLSVNIKILKIVVINKKIKASDSPFNELRYSTFIDYQAQIKNYEEKKKCFVLKWKFDNNKVLCLSRYWLKNKRLFSDIIGDMFCCYYIPNQSKLALRLCQLPNGNINALGIKWSVYIKEIDFKFENMDKISYNHVETAIILNNFAFKQFKTFYNVTFIINIEIVNEFDVNGNIIIQQKQKQKEKEKEKEKEKQNKMIIMNDNENNNDEIIQYLDLDKECIENGVNGPNQIAILEEMREEMAMIKTDISMIYRLLETQRNNENDNNNNNNNDNNEYIKIKKSYLIYICIHLLIVMFLSVIFTRFIY